MKVIFSCLLLSPAVVLSLPQPATADDIAMNTVEIAARLNAVTVSVHVTSESKEGPHSLLLSANRNCASCHQAGKLNLNSLNTPESASEADPVPEGFAAADLNEADNFSGVFLDVNLDGTAEIVNVHGSATSRTVVSESMGVALGDQRTVVAFDSFPQGIQKISVRGTTGKPVNATITARSLDAGLIVLKTEEPLPAGVDLQVDQPVIGQQTLVGIIPSPGSFEIASAMVTATNRVLNNADPRLKMELHADNAPGGAPVMNAAGNLVGLLGNSHGKPGHFAVTAATIRHLIEQAEQREQKHAEVNSIWLEVPQPWLGITLNTEENQVVVGKVHENSPAANAQIQEGEVLISIDDQPVENMEQLVAQIRRSPLDSQITVRTQHNGAELTRHVQLEMRPASTTTPPFAGSVSDCPALAHGLLLPYNHLDLDLSVAPLSDLLISNRRPAEFFVGDALRGRVTLVTPPTSEKKLQELAEKLELLSKSLQELSQEVRTLQK
ncbi:MAG: PDZ domain-containing protein [Planctomycetaceae bacterium]|nr:PDZ domain-containing protein [Planctomycetaceae bacterium]